MAGGERLIVRGVKAPVGDLRDWDVIRSWAESTSETLKTEASQPSGEAS